MQNMTAEPKKVLFARKAGVPELGYWLDFTPDNPEAIHDFCGPHEIRGAQCPYCAKPLLRLLSLNSSDPRLGFDAAKVHTIHLLYCWTCSIPYGEFAYRILPDDGIEILQIPPIYRYAFGVDGPYESYTGNFPHQRVALMPLSEKEHTQLQAAAISHTEPEMELATPRHQVGGYPFILNPSVINCPSCSHEIPLLAAICDDATGNGTDDLAPEHTFTGNFGTQMIFHFCRDCSVVMAYHSND